MIFRVCPCHGRQVIVTFRHDLCSVTREPLDERDVETRDTTKIGLQSARLRATVRA